MNELLEEVAELKKQEFVKLVTTFAAFRDVQYGTDHASSIQSSAEKIIAINLPSNLLRAAVIFVDYRHGFPPSGAAFNPPEWVLARTVLPKENRGSLRCGFDRFVGFTEGESVILIEDVEDSDLHAGMAGVIREVCDDESEEMLLVEFGEPQLSITTTYKIATRRLRAPRPGDMLEAYRL